MGIIRCKWFAIKKSIIEFFTSESIKQEKLNYWNRKRIIGSLSSKYTSPLTYGVVTGVERRLRFFGPHWVYFVKSDKDGKVIRCLYVKESK